MAHVVMLKAPPEAALKYVFSFFAELVLTYVLIFG